VARRHLDDQPGVRLILELRRADLEGRSPIVPSHTSCGPIPNERRQPQRVRQSRSIARCIHFYITVDIAAPDGQSRRISKPTASPSARDHRRGSGFSDGTTANFSVFEPNIHNTIRFAVLWAAPQPTVARFSSECAVNSLKQAQNPGKKFDFGAWQNDTPSETETSFRRMPAIVPKLQPLKLMGR